MTSECKDHGEEFHSLHDMKCPSCRPSSWGFVAPGFSHSVLSQQGAQIRAPFLPKARVSSSQKATETHNRVGTWLQKAICDLGSTTACTPTASLTDLFSASVRAVSYCYDLMASQCFQTCQNFLEYPWRKQSLCFLLVGLDWRRLCQHWNQWVTLADQRGDCGRGGPMLPS